jgi:hypothetical protein
MGAIHAGIGQSSRNPSDHGIDARNLSKTGELTIYQSKFTESKALVLQGLDDLNRAYDWLESVLIDGKVDI